MTLCNIENNSITLHNSLKIGSRVILLLNPVVLFMSLWRIFQRANSSNIRFLYRIGFVQEKRLAVRHLRKQTGLRVRNFIKCSDTTGRAKFQRLWMQFSLFCRGRKSKGLWSLYSVSEVRDVWPHLSISSGYLRLLYLYGKHIRVILKRYCEYDQIWLTDLNEKSKHKMWQQM